MKVASATAAALAMAVPAGAQDRPSVAPKNMQAIAPALAGYTDRVLFGDVWRRPELSPRDRSLVTIAALSAGGDSDQFAFHVQRARENGLTEAQIVEAITHLVFYAGWPKANAAVGVAGNVFANQEIAAMSQVQIIHAGEELKPGSSDYFTGSVSIASPFKGTGDARLGGATVTFQPGAHTNWHTHPLGQLLIVTVGRGWVQVEGEAAKPIASGDTVFIAPGVKHWHGAARDSALTHVAVAEALDDATVTWLEPVAGDVYNKL